MSLVRGRKESKLVRSLVLYVKLGVRFLAAVATRTPNRHIPWVQGAKFYREGMSMQYAGGIVKKVWAAARQAGFGSYFPKSDGGMITDDHTSRF